MKVEEVMEVVEVVLHIDSFVGMYEPRRVLDGLSREVRRLFFNAYAYHRSDIRR